MIIVAVEYQKISIHKILVASPVIFEFDKDVIKTDHLTKFFLRPNRNFIGVLTVLRIPPFGGTVKGQRKLIFHKKKPS